MATIEQLLEKYKEYNTELQKCYDELNTADNFGKAELAREHYLMTAMGMLMIQANILMEQNNSILRILEDRKA